jgi:hypothetical protein
MTGRYRAIRAIGPGAAQSQDSPFETPLKRRRFSAESQKRDWMLQGNEA